MGITLSELQAVNELADLLYDYLPGHPHPYADQTISFPAVAARIGLAKFWNRGSKKPAIAQLLSKTLEFERAKFCDLILGIVKTGMIYSSNKGDPVTIDAIKALNNVIQHVGFKIPELWDPAFLDTLPRMKPEIVETQNNDLAPNLEDLFKQLLELNRMEPQPRGFAFEKLLKCLFEEFGLEPKGSFRLTGEQIDGSFQLGNHTYLLEAKWQNSPVDNSQLSIFYAKVDAKAKWSRGLYISHSGFTKEGLLAFQKGRPTNIIGFSGQDLFFIISGKMSLQEAIELKARKAAETGEFFVPLYDLFLEG